jgi:hypothetical protein
MTQFHQLRRSITSYDPKELFRRSPLPYHDVRAIGIIPQNSECYTIPTSSFCPLPLKCLFALTHRDGEQPKGDIRTYWEVTNGSALGTPARILTARLAKPRLRDQGLSNAIGSTNGVVSVAVARTRGLRLVAHPKTPNEGIIIALPTPRQRYLDPEAESLRY